MKIKQNMKAFYFRFIGSNGVPVGWIGFAMADTMDEVFNVIDQFGDPYCVQLYAAKEAGFCVQWKPFPDGSGDAVMEKPPELIESMPWVFDDDDGWTTPAWCLN